MQKEFERIFNIRCAEYVGVETEIVRFISEDLLAVKDARDDFGMPIPYDPYNDLDQLISVADTLFLDERYNYLDSFREEIQVRGMKDTLRQAVAECLITDADTTKIINDEINDVWKMDETSFDNFEEKNKDMINNIIQGEKISNVPPVHDFEEDGLDLQTLADEIGEEIFELLNHTIKDPTWGDEIDNPGPIEEKKKVRMVEGTSEVIEDAVEELWDDYELASVEYTFNAMVMEDGMQRPRNFYMAVFELRGTIYD